MDMRAGTLKRAVVSTAKFVVGGGELVLPPVFPVEFPEVLPFTLAGSSSPPPPPHAANRMQNEAAVIFLEFWDICTPMLYGCPSLLLFFLLAERYPSTLSKA
jgi:hypothetical protein